MFGGSGKDHFVYLNETYSAKDTDTIMDFEQGRDVLDLSALGFTGIQAGAASGNVLGYAIFSGHTVIADSASGEYHFTIRLNGEFHFTADDFLF